MQKNRNTRTHKYMKRRDLLKQLTILQDTVSLFPPINSLTNSIKMRPHPSFQQIENNEQGLQLNRDGFVMDGHVNVMSRQLLQSTLFIFNLVLCFLSIYA